MPSYCRHLIEYFSGLSSDSVKSSNNVFLFSRNKMLLSVKREKKKLYVGQDDISVLVRYIPFLNLLLQESSVQCTGPIDVFQVRLVLQI